MKCTFTVGQKVVCIASRWRSDPRWRWATPQWPQQGGVYTIQAIEPHGDLVFLHLAEVAFPSIFDHRGFRPLDEKPSDTDIGVFTKLLTSRALEDA